MLSQLDPNITTRKSSISSVSSNIFVRLGEKYLPVAASDIDFEMFGKKEHYKCENCHCCKICLNKYPHNCYTINISLITETNIFRDREMCRVFCLLPLNFDV